MKVILFLLQKEFKQIFRDKTILRIIFAVPIIQLLILPWAADYEMKNINISVVDNDYSTFSRHLISKIKASRYFSLTDYTSSYHTSLTDIEKGAADIILEIPHSFEKSLIKENGASLFIAANAINGVKASLGTAYLKAIIRDFNQNIRLKWMQGPTFHPKLSIDVVASMRFNPYQNYKYYMVPGILVLLVTLVGTFLTALNIVKEKEIGTIEQINVTPIKKYQFILGKLIPFWILGQIVLAIGLGISWLFYGIHPVGNIIVIFVFSAVYLLAISGIGLLISTYSSTQQQAMLLSFFLMMVFILMGGLFTSIESMPQWAQLIAKLNPLTYFIEVMRQVILKGSGFSDIKNQMFIISIFAIIMNGWAVLSYKKQS